MIVLTLYQKVHWQNVRVQSPQIKYYPFKHGPWVPNNKQRAITNTRTG